MKKIIFVLIILLLNNINFYGQSKIESSVLRIDFYRNHSVELKNIIKSFSDSCQKLYRCPAPKKLIMSPSNLFEMNGEINFYPILLIDSGYISGRLKSGQVVLMVDSVLFFIDKKILFSSCLKDSLETIGAKSLKINYDEFELCLLRQNAIATMKFSCYDAKPSSSSTFTSFMIPRIYDEGRKRWYMFWKFKTNQK